MSISIHNRKAKIRMAVLTVATAALSGLATHTNADIIASYSFAGSTLAATTASPLTGVSASSVSSITGSTFTFPAGAAGGSGSPAASLNSFYSTAAGPPVVITPTGNGFAVTLTVTPGFSLNLDSVSFFDQVSATGPATGTVFIDGTSEGSVTNTLAFAASPFTVPLSLTGLTGTVTFDLVGGGTSAGFATNGTSVAGSAGTFRVDDLTFNGTVVTAVTTPEPATAGVATAGAVMLLTRRRRQAAK